MLPDRVSNPGPPTYESGVLPIALRGPAVVGYPANHQYLAASSFAAVNIKVCSFTCQHFKIDSVK